GEGPKRYGPKKRIGTVRRSASSRRISIDISLGGPILPLFCKSGIQKFRGSSEPGRIRLHGRDGSVPSAASPSRRRARRHAFRPLLAYTRSTLDKSGMQREASETPNVYIRATTRL